MTGGSRFVVCRPSGCVRSMCLKSKSAGKKLIRHLFRLVGKQWGEHKRMCLTLPGQNFTPAWQLAEWGIARVTVE